MIVNPRHVDDFAKAVEELARTDAIDEELEALLARRRQGRSPARLRRIIRTGIL